MLVPLGVTDNVVLKPRVKVDLEISEVPKVIEWNFWVHTGALIGNCVLWVSSFQVLRPVYPAYLLFHPIKLLHVRHISDVRSVWSSLSNLKVWCSPLFGCRRLVIQYIRKTVHIWRPSPPSASRGSAMPWWRRYTLTKSLNTHRKKSVFQIKGLPHCGGEPGSCSRFSDLLRAWGLNSGGVIFFRPIQTGPEAHKAACIRDIVSLYP